MDVNSAYLSWSAVSILREHPGAVDLRTIPSAVGGDVEKRHGVILAKSIPAKRFGVTTGEPVAQALRKCPNLVLVSPDFRIYNAFSQRFIAILNEYSPVVEQASIDEAYVDMTGTHLLYHDALSVAYEIKDRIRRELGFTVNIGISDSKLLAKMASDFEKPDKVHTLYSDEMEEKMWPLPVGNMFGIGKATAAQLQAMGMKTIGDVARQDKKLLISKFGVKSGTHLYDSVNGISHSEVMTEREDRKSYGNSVTLSEDVTKDNYKTMLNPILLSLSDTVASRMRKDGAKGITVTVQLRTSEFVNHSRQDTLAKPTDDADVIYGKAKELFGELWNKNDRVRLIGVTVSNIQDDTFVQMNLFEEQTEHETDEKKENLLKVTDEIRKKFGKTSITRGSLIKNNDTAGIGSKED